MPTKPEAAWKAFQEYALEPTASPELLAAMKLALVSGYLYGLADLGDAATKDHCMTCAWGKLIDDARLAQEAQAAKCNAMREKAAARVRLN